MISRPVNHRRRKRFGLSDWTMAPAVRNVIHATWKKRLSQVGFLKVFAPLSLIHGVAMRQKGRGK